MSSKVTSFSLEYPRTFVPTLSPTKMMSTPASSWHRAVG